MYVYLLHFHPPTKLMCKLIRSAISDVMNFGHLGWSTISAGKILGNLSKQNASAEPHLTKEWVAAVEVGAADLRFDLSSLGVTLCPTLLLPALDTFTSCSRSLPVMG